MKKFYKLLALYLSIILAFFLSVDALASDNFKHSPFELLEKVESQFKKENDELRPIGLNIKENRIKNICIAFNSGLHKMSQIEKLPLSFESPKTVDVPVLLYHHITLSNFHRLQIIQL